jgi:chromodomain-helicase-DNA-binding protein 1
MTNFSPVTISLFMKDEDQFESWCRRADPDDVEYAKCEREMGKELLSCYSQAERIIARDTETNPNGKPEYFVKWESLPYSEATWEAGVLIKKYFRPAVEISDKLRRASTIPENSKFVNSRPRPKFVREKVQPDYMKGDSKVSYDEIRNTKWKL